MASGLLARQHFWPVVCRADGLAAGELHISAARSAFDAIFFHRPNGWRMPTSERQPGSGRGVFREDHSQGFLPLCSGVFFFFFLDFARPSGFAIVAGTGLMIREWRSFPWSEFVEIEEGSGRERSPCSSTLAAFLSWPGARDSATQARSKERWATAFFDVSDFFRLTMSTGSTGRAPRFSPARP